MPDDVELVDYLPKTELGSEFAGPITTGEHRERSTNSSRQLFVTVTSGGRIGYRLPGVDGEAGLKGKLGYKKKNAESEQVVSTAEIRFLPPKQVVMAAGTEKRASVLYFKLRPTTQFKLEGDKEFAMLLRVPKEWRSGCMKLDCVAIGENNTEFRQRLGIGLYTVGNSNEKRKIEKLARKFDTTVTTSQPNGPKKPKSQPSKDDELSFVGSYDPMPSSTVRTKKTFKKNGTWKSTSSLGTVSGTWKLTGNVLVVKTSKGTFLGFGDPLANRGTTTRWIIEETLADGSLVFRSGATWARLDD